MMCWRSLIIRWLEGLDERSSEFCRLGAAPLRLGVVANFAHQPSFALKPSEAILGIGDLQVDSRRLGH
jgi:hypothetical protein